MSCVTATRGEHGTADPRRWPPARLAAVREQELAASLAILGVEEHHWLSIEDGTCASVSPIRPIAAISRLIREVSADTVVLWPGRPDRPPRPPCRLPVDDPAWAASGAKGRLLYTTCTSGFATRFRTVHDRFAVFEPGLPPETPEEDLALRLRLHGEVLDRKIVALRAHASQTSALIGARVRTSSGSGAPRSSSSGCRRPRRGSHSGSPGNSARPCSTPSTNW